MVFARSKIVHWEPVEMNTKMRVLLFLNYYEDVTLAIAAAIVT